MSRFLTISGLVGLLTLVFTAGAEAARLLKRAGHDVLILDKAEFPRLKLCGGWITSQALKDLDVED